MRDYHEAEKSIYRAMEEIKKFPENELTIAARILLSKAKENVSDYLDFVEEQSKQNETVAQ